MPSIFSKVYMNDEGPPHTRFSWAMKHYQGPFSDLNTAPGLWASHANKQICPLLIWVLSSEAILGTRSCECSINKTDAEQLGRRSVGIRTILKEGSWRGFRMPM